jgi:hypothetical protein
MERFRCLQNMANHGVSVERIIFCKIQRWNESKIRHKKIYEYYMYLVWTALE